MKKYLKPQNRIIDLAEEGNILSGSQFQEEEEELEIHSDYANEALSNKQRPIWKDGGLWSK